jgi:hypothetical protein
VPKLTISYFSKTEVLFQRNRHTMGDYLIISRPPLKRSSSWHLG